MCNVKRRIFLFFVLIIIFFGQKIFAAEIQLQTLVTSLNSIDQEVPVDVKLFVSNPQSSPYYLRGVFYFPDTSNYCGYTYNGLDWYKGPYSTNEGWKKLLKVIEVESSWSGILKLKFDPTDTGCNKNGRYNIKIQRYTESGSSTIDPQIEIAIDILIPTPTSTIAPTAFIDPSPTIHTISTVNPSPTVKIITPTELPVKVSSSQIILTATGINPTKKVILSPAITTSNQSIFDASATAKNEDVKGVQLDSSADHSVSFNPKLSIPVGLSVAGFGFALLSGALALKKYVQIKDQKSE